MTNFSFSKYGRSRTKFSPQALVGLMVGVVVIIALAYYFLSPAGWPSDLTEKFESLNQDAEKVKQELVTEREEWVRIKDSAKFLALTGCREEDWEWGFGQAERSLGEAGRQLDLSLSLIKKADLADESKLRVKLASVQGSLDSARKRMKNSKARLDFLTKVAGDPTKFMDAVRNNVYKLSEAKLAMVAILERVQSSYAHRLADAQKKSESFLGEVERLKEMVAKAEVEAKKLSENMAKTEVDYAKIGDAYTELSKKKTQLLEDQEKLHLNLSGLFSSRELFLLEEKAKFFATFLMVFYDDEGSYEKAEFELEVSEDYWLFLNDWLTSGKDEFASGLVKIFDSNFTWDNKSGVYGPAWEAVEKASGQVKRPFGYSEADIFVAGLSVKAWHRYRLVTNGKTTETGWEEVDFEDFWKHHGLAGAVIESKPYGSFLDETIVEALPPGINLVGNSAYGTWRGEGETSTWVWNRVYASYADWSIMWWDAPDYSYHDHSNWRTYRVASASKSKPANFWQVVSIAPKKGVAPAKTFGKTLAGKLTTVSKKAPVSADNVSSLTTGSRLGSSMILKTKNVSNRASGKVAGKVANKAFNKASSKALSKANSKASSKASAKSASKSSSKK